MLEKILIQWKKITIGSINRKIFSASVTVGLWTAFVKVVSVLKELVTAWMFGTRDDMDAFLIAFLVPTLLINVVACSLSSALIPSYIRVLEQEGRKAGQKLFSGMMLCSLGVLTITIILMVTTAPLYLPFIASGFDKQKLDLTFNLLCCIAPVVMLSGIISIWGGVLNAGENFALAALSPIITPIMMIVLLLAVPSWGIFALATGLVFGAAIEIVVMGAALHKRQILLLPKWYGFDANLRQVASQYAPMIAGALLICSASTVDQAMAAMLSPGSVAALNYGNKVIASPISLITTALGTAVVPYFSKMVAFGDWKGLNRTLKKILLLIFFTTVPLTGFLLVFSELITQVLFQRGSFTHEDMHLVSQIQSFYSLQIPFYIGNLVLVRFMTSIQKSHILILVSGVDLMINIAFNYLFMQLIGIKGIALSTSCVYLFSFSFLFVLSNKQIRKNINSDSKT